MTFPTDPAVVVILTNGRSGHSDYDRGIRDHMGDAGFSQSDHRDAYGMTWWMGQALALAHLTLADARYHHTLAQTADAREAAIASLRGWGDTRAIADLEGDLRRFVAFNEIDALAFV